MEHSILLKDQNQASAYLEQSKTEKPRTKTLVQSKHTITALYVISIAAFSVFLFMLNLSLWIIVPVILACTSYLIWKALNQGMEITIELDDTIEKEITIELFSRND